MEQRAWTAADAARACGVSRSHWLNMNTQQRVPRPIRLGRAVRWSAEEIRAWLAAGGPPREVWEKAWRRQLHESGAASHAPTGYPQPFNTQGLGADK